MDSAERANGTSTETIHKGNSSRVWGGVEMLPRKASDRRLVWPTLRGALLGLEIGTNQATLPAGAGSFGETPTYSAFRDVFGATCLRLQRLAASTGFGTTARLGPRKSLPYSEVS
jgi:hypothetical protein